MGLMDGICAHCYAYSHWSPCLTQLRPKSHHLVPSFLSQCPVLLSHQLQTWLLSRLLYTSFINTSSPSKSQFRSAPTYFAYSFQAVPRILPSSYQRLASLLALCLLWFYTAKFYSFIPCCNYYAPKGLHDVCTRSYKSKLYPFFKTASWPEVEVLHLLEERAVVKTPSIGQNLSGLKEMTLCSKEEKSFPKHMEIKVRNKIICVYFPSARVTLSNRVIFKNVPVINQR